MSDLQLALAAGGGVFILGVIAYNFWQERSARTKAEKAFGARPPDVLFEDRKEPTIGAMPAEEGSAAAPGAVRPAPPAPHREELEVPGGPAAEVSSRIDTVAVILADDPVMLEQLDPLTDALSGHAKPIHIEGIVDEQWHPVDSSPKRSWRELRVGLQLANRQGPVAEDEVERFNAVIAEFAASVNAVSQREAPSAAAARAMALDAFAADVDIEVAVNVIGQFGATFALPRLRALALDHGLSETAAGEIVSFAGDGSPEFTLRRLEDPKAKGPATAWPGITFAMDLPNVADPVTTLGDMVALARAFAEKLTGQVVDDNRKPLTDAGVATIRRSVDQVVAAMESQGIPAGSPLARRLFA
jgi:hypothetical protein